MKSLKLAVVVALVVGTTSAVAATVSVAKGDNLATKVAEARELAIAGDTAVTVEIAPGTYELEREIVVDSGICVKGTSTREETIVQAAPDHRAFVITDGTVSTLTVRGATWTQGLPQDTTIGVNPSGDNFGYGVLLTTPGTPVLTNCVVENVAVPNWRGAQTRLGAGVATYNNSNALVTDCLVRNCSGDIGRGGGVFLWYGTLRNSVVTNNTSNGEGTGVSVFVGGNVYNCLIAYNTATSGDCGGLCEQGWTYKNMYNNTVVHNVAKKAPAGIKVSAGTFRNCIVWGNTLSDDGSVSDASDSNTGTLFYNCSLSSDPGGKAESADNVIGLDPLFADEASGDFRLQRASPCIDAGCDISSAEVKRDLQNRMRPIDGNLDRVAKYDIGCYEFDPMLDGAAVSFEVDRPVAAQGTECAFTATFVDRGEPVQDATYEWDFGDGTLEAVTEASVVHTYDQPGCYTVSVRATKGLSLDEVQTLVGAVRVFPAGMTEAFVAKSGSGEYPFDTIEKATNDLSVAVAAAKEIGAAAGRALTVSIAPGTYGLTSELLVDGDLRLRGTGAREETVVTQLTDNQRVVVVKAGTLDTLTVRGGNFTKNRIDPNPTGSDNHLGYTAYLTGKNSLMTNCVVEGVSSSNGTKMKAGNLAVMDAGVVRDSLLQGGSALFENAACVYNQFSYVRDSLITGGHATNGGGGVWVYAGGHLSNCIVTGNVSDGDAGGIQVNGWSWQEIHNCTIVGNTAARGAAMVCSEYGDVKNCILWGNVATGEGQGEIYNIAYKGHLPTFVNCCSDEVLVGGSGCRDNIVADPLFVDAANGDFRLTRGSPCIDAGVTKPHVNTAFDMQHRARPIDGNLDGVAKYDIGAYEFDPALDASMIRATRTSAAVVVAGGAVASFECELVSGGQPVQGVTYTWDFGDGTVPVEAVDATDVTHEYAMSGVFDVTVTGRKGALCETAVLRRAVTVHPEEPVARVYVSTSGTAAFPYASEDAAARSMADAVHAVRTAIEIGRPAAEIVVGDGTYLLSDELLVDNGMRVVSANGPEATKLVQTNLNHRIFVISHPGLVAGFTLVGTNFNQTAVESEKDTTGGYIVRQLGKDGDVGGTVLSNCYVTGLSVTATSGSRHGAINSDYGRIVDCRIFGNGGNITYGACGWFNNASLVRCTIVSNTCSSCGAVRSDGRMSMYNCLIADNVATDHSAGVYFRTYSGSWIQNCTIAGNRAAAGAGAGLNVVTGSWTYFHNCVIGNNWSGDEERNVARDTDVTFTYCCSPEELNGANDSHNVTADPEFADAASSDYRLSSSSPCVDAGNNANAPSGTDLDGNDRIVDGKHTGTPTVDIGCYEYAPAADETLVFISRNTPAEILSGATSEFSAAVLKGGADVDPSQVTYEWSFGDGASESGVGKASVTHAYAPGRYTVTLTVTVDGVQVTAGLPNAVTVYGSSTAYVSLTGGDEWPYDTPDKATPSPETALAVVRRAVSAGFASGEVVVADGDYEIDARMILDIPVTLRSENGPSRTVIRPVNSKAITMMKVSNAKAKVSGITLADSKNKDTTQVVALNMSAGLATNCVIRGMESSWLYNSAPNGCALTMSGGLAVEMTITNNISPTIDFRQNASPVMLSGSAVLDRSVVADNSAGLPVGPWITEDWSRKIALTGGGVYLNGANAVCRNTFITRNRTVHQPGAGAYVSAGTLENCTVTGNGMTAPTNGTWSAGVYAWPGAKVVNCIIDGNLNGTAVVNAGGESDTALDEAFTYCCVPGFALGGVGCIGDDPQLTDGFVPDANTVGGKGLKAPWMKTAKDLVGRRRIIGGKVDIGCYETDFTYGLMLLVR